MQGFVGRRWLDDPVLVKRQSLTRLEILRSSESPKVPSLDLSNYTAGTDRKRFEKHGTKFIAKPKYRRQYQLFNVVNVNTVISDEEDKIQEWLSPLKPHQRHQGVQADRLDGVGDWFLETSEFRKWSNGGNGSFERVLFCSGGPGVGKTYLWWGHPTFGKGKESRYH